MSQTVYGGSVAEFSAADSGARRGLCAAGLIAALFLGGCAASEQPAATHRWVALDQVSGVAYRVDNNQCARETLGETGPRVLKTNSEAYDLYVACMNERGYVLTAYNDGQDKPQAQ